MRVDRNVDWKRLFHEMIFHTGDECDKSAFSLSCSQALSFETYQKSNKFLARSYQKLLVEITTHGVRWKVSFCKNVMDLSDDNLAILSLRFHTNDTIKKIIVHDKQKKRRFVENSKCKSSIERMVGLNQKCSRRFRTIILLLSSLLPPLRHSYDNDRCQSDPHRYIIQTIRRLIFKDSQRFAWIPFRRQHYTPRNAFWEKSFNIEKNMGVYIVSPICRSVEFEIAFFFFFFFILSNRCNVFNVAFMDSTRKSVHFLKSHFPFHKCVDGRLDRF